MPWLAGSLLYLRTSNWIWSCRIFCSSFQTIFQIWAGNPKCNLITATHNIIQIHNNVMWDWRNSIEYFRVFSTFGYVVVYGEPRSWPCNGEDSWLSFKGCTMGVGKAVLCSHGPSNIVWSENVAGPLHILLAGKKGGEFGLLQYVSNSINLR